MPPAPGPLFVPSSVAVAVTLAPQQATVLVNQLPTLQYLQRQTQPYQIKVHQLQKLQALKYRLLNYKQQLPISQQKHSLNRQLPIHQAVPNNKLMRQLRS